MVVLGGMGSISGSIVAALVLSLSLEGLREAQQYRMVMYSLLLIILMLTRPSGIFGTREIWDWLPKLKGRRAQGQVVVNEPVLEARKVTMQFGGLKALVDFDLELRPRELVGMIGPNGAGKTTAFNAITGVYPPTSGDVMVSGEPRQRRAAVPHLPAGRRPDLPEHPALQGPHRARQRARRLPSRPQGRVHGVLPADRPLRRRRGARSPQRADEYLQVMGLAHRRNEIAKSLPYGEQRRLEIARALATGPKVLCLDEPAAGMNASEKVALMELIRKIRDEFGLAILVIEHDMRVVMGVSERLVVLDHGDHHRPRHAGEHPEGPQGHRGVPGRLVPRGEAHRRPRRARRPRGGRVSEPILQIKDLRVSYGAIEALRGISLEVPELQVVALIGANGAGKTTTLRAISRMLRPSAGSVKFRGEEITRLAAARDRGPRAGPRPGGARDLPQPDGAREPRARRLPAQGHGRHRARPRQVVRALPHPQGAHAPGGGDAVGWRAADAGGGAGP